jgi:pyruvate dehydrogenase E2 component (dihydrolipoamide acetyltransferase)
MYSIQLICRKSYRCPSSSLIRLFSSYPKHVVVGMPALSPTMSAGTIGTWHCKVGDFIKAGETFAEVETDKASMAFEAQDESYVAKFLVESGVEVNVGTPILITVEDAADVPAFASYKLEAVSSSTPAPTPAPAPVAPSPQSKPAPAEVKAAPIPAPVVEKAPSKPEFPKPVAPVKPTAPVAGAARKFQYGKGVENTPLSKILAKEQAAYIAKYGKSFHKPIGA